MSDVRSCPKCGAKAKYKVKGNIESFEALQDEELLKKVGQLKKAIKKFKDKAEGSRERINRIKI